MAAITQAQAGALLKQVDGSMAARSALGLQASCTDETKCTYERQVHGKKERKLSESESTGYADLAAKVAKVFSERRVMTPIAGTYQHEGDGINVLVVCEGTLTPAESPTSPNAEGTRSPTLAKIYTVVTNLHFHFNVDNTLTSVEIVEHLSPLEAS